MAHAECRKMLIKICLNRWIECIWKYTKKMAIRFDVESREKYVQQRVSERAKMGKINVEMRRSPLKSHNEMHCIKSMFCGKQKISTNTNPNPNTNTSTHMKTWNPKENLHINCQAFIFYLLLATCHLVLHRCKPFDLWVCTTFIWLE